MTEQIAITQGTTQTRSGSVVGFMDAYDEERVSLGVWDENEKFWSARFDLRRGEALPAGGQFLRLADWITGVLGERDRIELAAVSDSAGIKAVPPTHPVLPAQGRLEVGLSRLELVGGLTRQEAQAEMWPKLSPRDSVEAKDLQSLTLKVGQTLAFGNKTLRVVRLQPSAGEIVGFVEFEVVP
ncbi:hypothetical protein [Luteimonas aquatica]|uniref:hypothetical protein n=1 Tax=Luteimonas aquatica TaxID=450364 RepID=UPI001F58B59E|nr:hypothetical protein [Luteimonas aquatica]